MSLKNKVRGQTPAEHNTGEVCVRDAAVTQVHVEQTKLTLFSNSTFVSGLSATTPE